MYDCKYPHLFEPIVIGKRVFKNRIFASPTGNSLEYDIPETDSINYCERKAKGGAASVCVGDGCVDSEISYHGLHHICPEDRANGMTHLSRLARAILEREKVPFYAAAWSNVRSIRNGLKCGFRPAWAVMTARQKV